MCRRGLTIVELLVVLAIISVLLALLLPAVHSARERAREMVCKNNLHQINLALAQFAETREKLPAPPIHGVVGGWMVDILPYVEDQSLQDSIPSGLLIADARETSFEPPLIFRCPRRTTLDGGIVQSVWPGHYVFVPMNGRDTFDVFDAPIDLTVPWLVGPEMAYERIVWRKGPHSEGFYFAQGFQQGVSLMLNGQEVR